MLRDIPLNLVTGFLGAGKTTLVRHLLGTRPSGERWAVLVNEFGATGIDGALLDDIPPAAGEVFVREVPGGCLCCANGVPFRIALNQLLKQALPARVLVEPTGLGHPLQLLAALSAPEYQGVLDLRATLCVIDPVAVSALGLGRDETFRQQLAAADVLVVNHADRADDDQLGSLAALLADLGLSALPRPVTSHGVLDVAWLDHPRRPRGWQLLPPPAGTHLRHAGATWPAEVVFPHDDTLSLLLALPVARLKAVLHTDRGWIAVNVTPSVCETGARGPSADNRVEMIVAGDAGLPEPAALLGVLLETPAR